MNDKEMQCRALSCTAWGYFFLTFNIHIGTVGILPGFVGFLLLLYAIHLLSEERRKPLLLCMLCIFLAAIGIINWFLSILGRGLDGSFLVLDLLAAVAGLYFHFRFLTDIAALAETCPDDGKAFAVKIRRCRTAYILLHIMASVCSALSKVQASIRFWSGAALFLSLACVVVCLLLMAALFGLRKRF